MSLLHHLGRRCIAHSSSGDAVIRQYASKSSTTISLSDLITYTSAADKMQDYGQFIHSEIPIRVSHRVVELQSLPYNLSNTTSITDLRDLYARSFYQFVMLESPDNDDRERKFIEQMKRHFDALKEAVPSIAKGLTQCLSQNPNQSELIQACPFLNAFLDRFHAARLGTRLLTGQYIACKEQEQGSKKKANILGLIDFECDPKAILEIAIDDASRLCETNYGKSPDVNIQMQEKEIKFAYIPSDLHYMFFELMKNAMRAVCEHYPSDCDSDDLPPIECVIVASSQSQDVTIKISDCGGGISRENMQKIWYYSFTTIVAKSNDPLLDRDDQPMSGFGYGLPLSRLYAKYFGGDLEVISMDGFGTDVFLYLNWLKPDDTRKLRKANVLQDSVQLPEL